MSGISLLSSCSSNVPDFAHDIAPMMHKNCSPCHRPGGGAPFNLLTYLDAAKRSKMIALVTSLKYMPPWPADKNYSHFLNERFLSDQQIELFKKWYENNCPPGDTANLSIPNSVFLGSVLGKPDTVLNVVPVQIIDDNLD
ncbi:MAG: cytochrome c, partial [Bacteroidia bacterium]|nr:cytochrome c [Bacteroidia bacterium]